jgi:hypothetical protein
MRRMLRMLVEPTDRNGLRITSRLAIDRVTTVPKVGLAAVPKLVNGYSDSRSERGKEVREQRGQILACAHCDNGVRGT